MAYMLLKFQLTDERLTRCMVNDMFWDQMFINMDLSANSLYDVFSQSIMLMCQINYEFLHLSNLNG